MGQISLFGAHLGKYPWREKKNLHVWIPLGYPGVIIFVRDWGKWLQSDHNLHIILVSGWLGRNSIVDRELNYSKSRKQTFYSNGPPPPPPSVLKFQFTFYWLLGSRQSLSAVDHFSQQSPPTGRSRHLYFTAWTPPSFYLGRERWLKCMRSYKIWGVIILMMLASHRAGFILFNPEQSFHL